MSIYAPSRGGFQSLLRIAVSSVAEPPWFATPVDAEEDQDALTVVFHAPERKPGQVRVQASDQSVTVWGSRRHGHTRPMRFCKLSCAVMANKIQTSRSGDLLRVRIPKKTGAFAALEPSPPRHEEGP